MKEQGRPNMSFGRAAAATALIGLVVAVSAGSAHATPAGASASVVDDVLVISGTNAADRISVDFTVLGTVVVNLGHDHVQRLDPRTFNSVSVYLRAGDDDFRTLSGGSLVDVPLTVRAGAGDDTVVGGAANDVLEGASGDDFLLGGAGTDLVFGGRGADFVNGGVGTDTEVLGSGDDTAAWNPGEGNDAISGGRGRDTLSFNGSDGDERMSLTADGTSAVFLRSPGAIRMDLKGVERLELATLGGADAVTIGDLSGTPLTVADIDLSSAAGSGDAKADSVVVNGTNRPDRVDVAAHAGAVDVTGLTSETVVTGGEPADRLEIDTFEGDDSVTVDDAARALLDIAVDLGADQS
jgi:Hemolysin-type calcium-binding repeat (2 copies).